MLCNSLNMERGTQQDFHYDTFFMPPVVPNKMLVTWIALDDCTLDAGPLVYYSGSHKIEPYRFSHGRLDWVPQELHLGRDYYLEQAAKRHLEPQAFAAQAGDVFIWHAQLLHGGAPIQDSQQTRKSLVSHYFRTSEHPGAYTTVGEYRHHLKRDERHDQVSLPVDDCDLSSLPSDTAAPVVVSLRVCCTVPQEPVGACPGGDWGCQGCCALSVPAVQVALPLVSPAAADVGLPSHS